ncbi:uncharacterized protein LOC122281433 isoform X3 [Carya illinoinensis]|uniref:uncharacterized protein LOC122281433 isoform X3 n=1 Tax=Carya illinoinensis TaxID=32201 RepID=UPI001C726AC4|nr:uncharacterized protein LOC122281433 isoform X3 [Carya illinoinensis]
MLTANIFATSNQFPLVKREGQCRGHTKLTGSNQVKTFFVPFQEFSGKTRTLEIVRAGPPGLGAQILPIDRRGPTIHSTRTQSASLLCHSSLNARCGAEQTQTVTREAPTITHVPDHG